MTRRDARVARHYCAPAPSPGWVKGRPKNGPAQQAKSLPLNPQLRTCPNDPARRTLSAKTGPKRLQQRCVDRISYHIICAKK
jgi:hypothetical protein